MTNVTQLKPKTASFDDLKAIWPVSRRGSISLARQIFANLVSPGDWTTRVQNRDSGLYEPMTYPQQDPEQIIEAAKAYIQSHCLPNQTFAEMWGGHPQLEDGGKYVQQLATWLNRGGFEQ